MRILMTVAVLFHSNPIALLYREGSAELDDLNPS
jgi:hypothetical protein